MMSRLVTKRNAMLGLLASSLLAMGSAGLVRGDDGDHERRGHGEYRDQGGHDGWVRSRADVSPVTNTTYGRECGSCHMAYQPGLLPARDWTAIMAPESLARHYGDDATLSDAQRQEIAGYLSANGADRSGASRSRAFAAGAAGVGGQGDALPRITQTRYFLRKHDEIPVRLVTGNPEVGSFSQCDKCHRGAADGVFNEHQVDIPGHGPWED